MAACGTLCAVDYPGEKLNAMLHVYIQAYKYFITLHPNTDMYDKFILIIYIIS